MRRHHIFVMYLPEIPQTTLDGILAELQQRVLAWCALRFRPWERQEAFVPQTRFFLRDLPYTIGEMYEGSGCLVHLRRCGGEQIRQWYAARRFADTWIAPAGQYVELEP